MKMFEIINQLLIFFALFAYICGNRLFNISVQSNTIKWQFYWSDC